MMGIKWILAVLAGVQAGCWTATISAQETEETQRKPRLVLLLAPYDVPHRDLAAMTLAWMAKEAGAEFDVYYAADHQEGGLFAPHGSSLIGGQHALRIGRALAAFRTTVVRLAGVSVFDSMVRSGAEKVVDGPGDLPGLYATAAKELGLHLPAVAVALEPGKVPLAALYPECVQRKALAVPLGLPAEQIARLGELGVNTVWTVARADADVAAWKTMQVKQALDLSLDDPNLAVVERYISGATGVDTLEPTAASYLMPFCIREGRLILTYRERGPEAEKRRDQMLRLTADKQQTYALGRWYGDPQLLPLATRPMGYNVAEPHRHILSVFSRHPVTLPQPAKSWLDLEPSDEQLRQWAADGKILATWVLHSGELSHNDSVLTFYDWCAMTKVKLGAGVHWQRYHWDPDAVEPMHVPVGEGGVLGLVEPVLHATGAGIIWETAADPQRLAALMADSRKRIAQIAGERFAPRGVYCFGDHHAQAKDADAPGAAQLAVWKAVKDAGFEYLITSVLPGDSRILYRDGDFVVLNQAGRWHSASPFVRGDPATFAAAEKEFAEAGQPGWLVGAIDCPIHGCPIYVGRPYGGKNPQPRINEFYDYIQRGGATGKVLPATPRTIARYARLIADRARPAPAADAARAPVVHRAAPDGQLLVEAEGFEKLGGWVLDTQFAELMGSPFLLAHGLGEAVPDAVTRVQFNAAGRYRLRVRTRDWAPGEQPGPGRFQVLLDGQPVGPIFGVEGQGKWTWQDGGTVTVRQPDATLALHDLTGFEGRCDAVLFVPESAADGTPPDDLQELTALRRQLLQIGPPETVGKFDLVVTGGGYAGLCAAVAAAQLGLQVALVQDRPALGGNASSEVGVKPIGKFDVGPYPRNADIVKRLMFGQDAHHEQLVRAEKNVKLMLNTRAYAVEKDGARITAVLARDTRTGRELRFAGELFADCTGDGWIGFWAGAEYRTGREGRDETGESLAPPRGDKQSLGASQYWYATERSEPQPFPACPWALAVPSREAFEVSPPKYQAPFGRRDLTTGGWWNWETGFGRDMIADAEWIRDHNFRAVYGVWDFLKNRSPDKSQYANFKLARLNYQLGKRESRRLVGDLVLTQQDIQEHKLYPDGCVTATWYFDLHFPHPLNTRHFPGQEFRAIAFDDPNFEKYRGEIPGREITIQPYPIPYRCLYSKNVPNLFMAGRNISVTHAGLAPVRVMHTTGMMGTVVGRAAYLCRRHGVDPRGLYERHLPDFQRLLTDPKPLP
ncbi:MAG: FAD-dependent oxidoreductase [Pirellulaceae bacterium]|nr:FAD-dependent oxidoreductase [Pirellulaceae bacterium]